MRNDGLFWYKYNNLNTLGSSLYMVYLLETSCRTPIRSDSLIASSLSVKNERSKWCLQ